MGNVQIPTQIRPRHARQPPRHGTNEGYGSLEEHATNVWTTTTTRFTTRPRWTTTTSPKDDMFKKMMMKMMLKKMFNEDSSSPFGNMDSSSSDKFDMLKMLTQHMRSKRATDDIFELGDRLTEKLKSEQQEMQAQFGNASCVLQELDIVDQNLEIDVNAMVESVKKGEWGEFPDEWLKEHHIKDCRTCATFANSIPDLVFEDCPYGEKWGRIVMFFQCEHEQKYKTCMNHDMKQKLEKSFGKIEDLEQATGLPEYQLLPLTMKLLHEQMDMFNM